MALQTDKPELAFQLGYLAPKYWGTWLLLVALWIIMFLPRMWVMHLGAWVGDQFRRRNNKRRRIVEVNLELCFPDYTDAQRQTFCVEHFRAYGRNLVDMGLTLWGSPKKRSKLIRSEGLQEHIEVLKKHRVLVVSWHLTTIEISGSTLSAAGPAVSMMNRMKNPLLTWLIAQRRSRLTDVKLVVREEGLRAFISNMRGGRQGFIIPDEDFGNLEAGTVFAPFFGVQRAVLSTPARLAKSSKALVATCASRLDPATGKYIFTITAPLKGVDGSDLEADTRAIAASMEQLISLAPEQYMWTFRWFRTRPDGAPSPYDAVPEK